MNGRNGVDEAIQPPPSQRLYAAIVSRLTALVAVLCLLAPVLALYRPEGNRLDPHRLLEEIWSGRDTVAIRAAAGDPAPAERRRTAGLFSGGDGLALLGVGLAAGISLCALCAAALALLREREGFYALCCLLAILLIVLSMTGWTGS